MATALTSELTRFTDKCNNVLAGGIVKTFEPNSLTPKTSYQDPECTIPNLPEVNLDETGRARIYIQGDYRVQVYSRDGVLIEDNLLVEQSLVQRDFVELSQSLQVEQQATLNQFQAKADDVIAQGFYKSYATETALKASLPTVSEMRARADDTRKIWRWSRTSAEGVTPVTGTWTDTGLSDLDQANNRMDANPLFKPIQVKSGDDPDNFTKPGMYTLNTSITPENLPHWPLYVSGYACRGVLIAYSATDTKGPTLNQVFYPFVDDVSPYFRKFSGSSSSFIAWNQYITDLNKNNTLQLTSGADVFTLPLGTYNTPSIAIGNSLINMPECPYKFGRIEVKAGGSGHLSSYKVIVFYPYGRDKNFYINTNYESGTWTGWRTHKDYGSLITELSGMFTTKAQVSSQVESALVALANIDFFGKNYTEFQLDGNSIYESAYQVGFNDVTSSGGALFNRIKARISNNDSSVEWRIFLGNKCELIASGYRVLAANALLPDYSGLISNFPALDKINEIDLGKIVSIPANTPFVIAFKSVNLRSFKIGYFNSNTLGMPVRGFNLVATAVDWGGSNISVSSGSNYIQSGFQLKLALENSGSGTTPEPVQKHKPVVVMPPKLYVMRGLQAHIYPEHLLFERPSLYDHDIVCTKGKQMERGWVWDHNPDAPDPFGVVGLTWNIHDVETTELLSGGTTNLNFVDPNSKNGQNLKVCVIGDSLVNAASMTARLLAIAETDVTKIKLIGTRGSGLNLHEGRGGWTINDYTGTGRTYYKFDVSGVTTIPAINSATYKIGDTELLVQEVNISGGAGSIICSLNKGAAPVIGSSGVLAKGNGSPGDSSINYSNVQAVSGNPFWSATSNAVDFAGYISRYALELPDIVFIQLGVNDTFGLTTDQAVIDFCGTAFPKLDTLINSIKAANPSVKVVVMTPPVYADQNAFGTNYACNQTAWRAKRNIIGFNKLLIANYANKEANSIYLLGSGVNVDTFNNFPTGVAKINSHNQNNITIQVNGVHPDVSGYYQIGDAMWACLKAI